MNNCQSCGIAIPSGQSTCSMCYGDIDHGTDGYYRDYMERQQQDYEEQQQPEEGS